jgi:sugar/nucleoside kinase (ribokinase family)
VRVLVVGDIVTDIIAVYSGQLAVGSDTPATIRLLGGGSAANTAAWLAGRGRAVDLVAMVGDDTAGHQRVAELESAGVGCRYVSRTAQAATGAIVVLAHPGERSFLPDRGANLRLGPSHVDAALAGGSGPGHLHLSGYTLLDEASRPTGRHALTAARSRGWTTSVDAASAAPLRRAPEFLAWIRGVDILFANLDEARALAGPPAGTGEAEGLARRLRDAARHVVIKLGVEGALWVGPDGVATHPGQAATVVDPTGAGDAFAAGFLDAWLAGQPPLEPAVVLGAAAVSVLGGRPPRS